MTTITLIVIICRANTLNVFGECILVNEDEKIKGIKSIPIYSSEHIELDEAKVPKIPAHWADMEYQ